MERIKRINRMFNGTDQELRTIYKYETELVRDQLENQFSDFFTRKKRIHLCEYEKLMFPIVQEIMNIDLICIRKLEDESNIESFLRGTNIIERIKFAYDIDNETMEKNFNRIPNKAKKAIELLFNLTDENLTVEEILEVLDTDYDGLNRIVKNNLRFLFFNSPKEAQTNKSQKSVFVIPRYFFKYFEKMGYFYDDIYFAVESCTDSIKNTLKKIYGEFYNDVKNIKATLTNEDIQNLKNVFISPDKCLIHSIKEINKSIKIPSYTGSIRHFDLMNYYISIGYSKEIVVEVFKELSPLNKQILDLYFQSNHTLKPHQVLKFGQMLRAGEASKVYNLLFNPNEGIQQALKDKSNIHSSTCCSDTGMIIDVYQFYENLGYERETVKKALKQIDVDTLKAILKFYDENLLLRESYSQNAQFQKIISSTLINPTSYIAKNILDDKILPNYNDNINEKVYTNGYIHLGIRGIPANYVNHAISLLDPCDRAVLNKYYTSKFHLRDEIAINEQELDALFDKLIYLAINYNEIIKKSREEKCQKAQDVLINIGCSKDAVMYVINDLDTSTIEKIISSVKPKKNTSSGTGLLLTQFIIKSEYVAKICNLKDFIISLGYTDKEFTEFLDVINKYSRRFELSAYFDLDTFELKSEYRFDKETLEDLRHHLDYFLSIFIHHKENQSNIANIDNVYYSILNDVSVKTKNCIIDNKGFKASVYQKFPSRNINYYVLLSNRISSNSFDGLTELLIYRALFNNAYKEYIGIETELKKTLVDNK